MPIADIGMLLEHCAALFLYVYTKQSYPLILALLHETGYQNCKAAVSLPGVNGGFVGLIKFERFETLLVLDDRKSCRDFVHGEINESVTAALLG